MEGLLDGEVMWLLKKLGKLQSDCIAQFKCVDESADTLRLYRKLLTETEERVLAVEDPSVKEALVLIVGRTRAAIQRFDEWYQKFGRSGLL